VLREEVQLSGRGNSCKAVEEGLGKTALKSGVERDSRKASARFSKKGEDQERDPATKNLYTELIGQPGGKVTMATFVSFAKIMGRPQRA